MDIPVSEKCEIRVRSGGFAVYPRQPVMLEKTEFHNNQVVSRVVKPIREEIPGFDECIFWAEYDGDDWWTIDRQAGVQRWYGKKSTADVRAALRKCGFERKAVFAYVKSFIHDQIEPTPDTAPKANIQRIGKNAFHVLTTDGVILCSYETPVAFRSRGEVWRTKVRFSRTTERHIQDFIWADLTFVDTKGEDRDQIFFDELLQEAIGDIRIRGKRFEESLGPVISTEHINYSNHVEPGDKNLVIPIHRRR